MKTVWVSAGTNTDLQIINGLGLKGSIDSTWNLTDQPAAIKITKLNAFLNNYSGTVVLESSNPTALSSFAHLIDVLVLVNTQQPLKEMAEACLALGVKSVVIKGDNQYYWANKTSSFWLSQNNTGANAVFSTALTALLALEYSTEDAIVIASMYAHRAQRLSSNPVYDFPEEEIDLPYLSLTPLAALPEPFKPCTHLGLYPIVDSSQWVEKLIQWGVKTLQLRIKEKTENLENEIKRSIALAKKHQAILYINDDWELALKLGAQAVHLGQADLDTADLDAIRRQGLLLGVSTYCYAEVARAHTLRPSYIAIGPIYPTTSKDLSVPAQGLEQLRRWLRTLNYPLVAIGGISLERMPDVVASGVHGAALISAITEACDPQKATQELLRFSFQNLDK